LNEKNEEFFMNSNEFLLPKGHQSGAIFWVALSTSKNHFALDLVSIPNEAIAAIYQ
jgi:hypothetical protein